MVFSWRFSPRKAAQKLKRVCLGLEKKTRPRIPSVLSLLRLVITAFRRFVSVFREDTDTHLRVVSDADTVLRVCGLLPPPIAAAAGNRCERHALRLKTSGKAAEKAGNYRFSRSPEGFRRFLINSSRVPEVPRAFADNSENPLEITSKIQIFTVFSFLSEFSWKFSSFTDNSDNSVRLLPKIPFFLCFLLFSKNFR